MTKQELINEVQKDEYKQICKRMLYPLWEDLYQELNLIILEKPEEKIEKIKNENGARYYIVGILCNLVRSRTSPFYTKYRNTYELKEGNEIPDIKDEEYDTEQDERAAEAKEHLEKQYWFDKHIFKTYLEQGSIRKVEAVTKISKSIIERSIRMTKQNIAGKMRDINILMIVNGEDNGLTYHRQLSPHARLLQMYPEFKITKTVIDKKDNLEASIDMLTDEYLSGFDIVHYLRQISYSFNNEHAKKTIDRLHRLGCKIVFDIDDYWMVDYTHPLRGNYDKLGIPANTEYILKNVDYVTTTTDNLATHIRRFNKNVAVLPNCVHPEDKQFLPRPIDNNRVRFGWIGGAHHKADLDAISENFCRLYKDSELKDKFQVCLGGYNVGRAKDGQIKPNPEYANIEKNMSCNYFFKESDSTYMEYLMTYTPYMEHISYDKNYRRIYAQNVYNYGILYNEIDVALIPLCENEFNKCKSELKLIEAGAMGKAVIVSDTDPYKDWITHGKNGLKVKGSRNGIDWYLNMKKLIQEPNLRNDLAEGLKETVQEYFDMDTHNEARAELYKSLI